MGKVVKAIVGVGLAIVGVVTGNPWLVTAGLGIALSDQLVPEIPDATGNEATGGRLGRSVDPEARRKIVFGQTLAGMDQRYWEETNDEEAYHEVIALATHKIHSIGSFYIDGKACTFDGSGNITGPSQYLVPSINIFSGGGITLTSLLKRRTVLEGTASNGISVGSGSYWTSSQSTFTGCAYMALSWVYDEDGLPRGIPQKIKQEVEGALVYDPRKDSTRGGSGTHRADDQTTWEYAPLDSNGVPIGRNNALQVLWYLIGWQIEGVRVAGMGVDLDDIDFASFIEAANNCETMEWYSDGILSTGDAHKKNLGILSSASGGVVTDTGGIYNYRVAIDDTADIVVAFDENDIISEITGSPRRPMSEQFNEVAATFVDPRLGYQKAPLPLMDDPTYKADDGFTRRKSMSLDMVQDSEQGQKLTRLYLNKGRMQAEFTATFTRKAGRVTNMDCITITFPDWGWTNRLFRVTQTTYDPNGGITLTFREEDASVYSFGTVTPLPAPATLPGGNPHAKYSVGSLAASPTTFTAETSGAASGQVTDGVIISYDRPNQQVVQTQFRMRKITASSPPVASETNWELLPPVSNDKEAPTLNITSLLSLTDYGLQARHINKNGVKGDWQAEVTFTTGGDAVAIKAVEAEDPTLRRRTEWLTAATYNAIRDPLFKLGPGELWQKDDATILAFLDIDPADSDNRRLRVEVEGAKTVNLIYDRRMPVTEGDRVEFSGEFDRETTGVVTATANIDWYNSSGTLLSTSNLGGLSASYVQDGGFADAPANAHRCALRIAITTTGDGAFVMRKPFWRIADQGQTVYTEFDEGQAEDIAEVLSVRQVQAQQASLSQLIEVADADKSARIDAEVQARIDGDAAEATARTALEARVTTAEDDISTNAAAITSEASARASADSAITSDITALTARVTTNEGDISTNAAAITSEASARASADSALATDITNLTATVGTNTSGVSTNASAIADIESAAAYYSVEVAATGSTNAGVYLTAGETGSRVDLIADKLLFLNYDGTGGVIEAMRIEGGNVKIKQDLQLDSTNGAVSQTFGTSGEVRLGSLGATKYGLLVTDAAGNEKVRADQDGVEINGANWSTVVDDDGSLPEDNATQSRVFYQTGAPSSPTTNDIWFDTDDFIIRRWNGATWDEIGSLGADWGSNVRDRPVELTDGRIADGLETDGSIKLPVSGAVKTASDILSRTGGGDYTGDLNANRITDTNQIADSAGLGESAIWANVSGVGKPEDNATAGADWASNLSSRPTELTDGRVSAGLEVTGAIKVAVPGAVKTASDILSRTGGGTYTGDLGATDGADWASNVTSRPTELTDGRVSAGLTATGDVGRAIPASIKTSSDILSRTGGGTYTGALAATENTGALADKDTIGDGDIDASSITSTPLASGAASERWLVSSTGTVTHASGGAAGTYYIMLTTPYQNRSITGVGGASFHASGVTYRSAGTGNCNITIAVRPTDEFGTPSPGWVWSHLKGVTVGGSWSLSLDHFVGLIGEWWEVAILFQPTDTTTVHNIDVGYLEVTELRR